MRKRLFCGLFACLLCICLIAALAACGKDGEKGGETPGRENETQMPGGAAAPGGETSGGAAAPGGETAGGETPTPGNTELPVIPFP